MLSCYNNRTAVAIGARRSIMHSSITSIVTDLALVASTIAHDVVQLPRNVVELANARRLPAEVSLAPRAKRLEHRPKSVMSNP